MSDSVESTVARLWRDRVQLREQERDEAQARARLAEQKVAALTAENGCLAGENALLREQNERLAVEIVRFSDQNNRLAAELARVRAQLAPEGDRRTETEQQMEDLRSCCHCSINRAEAAFIDIAPNPARNTQGDLRGVASLK